MIKLGKLTDYAVVIMAQVAKEGEEAAFSANYLSEKIAVPEPTVAKILKQLARGNMVSSVRGAAGGYKLARPANDVSVAEIIEAMDGPIAIVSCVEGANDDCRAQGSCPVRGNWDRVNDAIKGALADIKLSELTFSTCGKTYAFMSPPEVARAAE